MDHYRAKVYVVLFYARCELGPQVRTNVMVSPGNLHRCTLVGQRLVQTLLAWPYNNHIQQALMQDQKQSAESWFPPRQR